jgi:hypothetical protein
MNQLQSARRLWLAALPAALILAMAFPVSAAAATVSESYAIRGFEYFATSTQGRFAGKASGSSGDSAAWNAVVDHTPLTTTTTITGGYADLATSNGVLLHGQFSGGSATQTGGFTGCTNQTYDVVGTLEPVTRSDSNQTGTGSFNATLTHYRTSVFGRCIVYSASVAGVITFSF